MTGYADYIADLTLLIELDEQRAERVRRIDAEAADATSSAQRARDDRERSLATLRARAVETAARARRLAGEAGVSATADPIDEAGSVASLGPDLDELDQLIVHAERNRAWIARYRESARLAAAAPAPLVSSTAPAEPSEAEPVPAKKKRLGCVGVLIGAALITGVIAVPVSMLANGGG